MAYVPPTKKSFSLSAIERWGERLSTEPNCRWEDFLACGNAEKGRALYREISHAVEIFLEDSTAAVQFRTEEDGDVHIIFSVDASGLLHWRTSMQDRADAAPFAIAAMYFVEEFIGEEFPNLPENRAEPAGANVPENAPKIRAPENAASNVSALPKKTLVLKFSAGTTSLECRAKWRLENVSENASKNAPENGSASVPALGKNALSANELSPDERAQLLRLATFARKAFFSYDAAKACYAVHGIALAGAFANLHFDKWQKHFEIENPQDAETFRSEPRELEAEAVLRADSFDAFSLAWNFSLGGEELSAEEIGTVVAHVGESVFLPGRGVVRIKNRAQSFVSDWPDTETRGIPVYTLLSLFRNENAAKISPDSRLSAWRKKFLARPKPLAGTPDFLRPYQARGVAWIRRMFERKAHPLVADEMGLGKTIQVLSLLSMDTKKNARALIVCPASVVPVWQGEIRKFFPQMSFSVLGGDENFARANAEKSGAKIVLASYGQLRRHATKLPSQKFKYAVLDEAQFIKNPQTKIARTCLEIRAEHRLALTGTPIENRHLDLWTIFRFLMPGLLGRRKDLEESLAGQNRSAEVLERLRTQIAPFILRRTKSEVAKELPEKTQNILYCPMLQMQRERYTQLVRNGLAASREIAKTRNVSAENALQKNPTNLLTLLMRLRQAACDPALLPGCADLESGHSGKISVLLERVREIIDNGGKIVIFSQFVMLLERVFAALRENFPDTPLFTLTGKTLDRETPVKDFQATDGSAIFLVSLRAGGTGLTLHSAEYVFLMDPWWNPAVEEQAIDRVHRIGQKKRVFVYRMVSAGTIEEKIEKLKQSKRELFDTLVGGIPDMSDWAAHYPSLESLIALSE